MPMEVEVEPSEHIIKMIGEAESMDILKDIWMSLSESEQSLYLTAVNNAKSKLAEVEA